MRKLKPWNCVAVVLVLSASAASAAPGNAAVKKLIAFNGTNGDGAYDALVQGPDGYLYGTTYDGGSYPCEPGFGCGTLFKIAPTGKFKLLHKFCLQPPDCRDGAHPFAGLVLASGGNFYGTTTRGGVHTSGVIFKITSTGKLTVLHNFDAIHGASPADKLVQATDGNFYGTTQYGGAQNRGTAFKITPAGKFTTLYSFCAQAGCSDGSMPVAALIQAADGNFYGTTLAGGAKNDGTVFRITPHGKLKILYSFTNGGFPAGALVQADNGELYGTAAFDGQNGIGSVFKIDLRGKLTTLYSFGGPDGSLPSSALIQATDGQLYGTTEVGGSGSCPFLYTDGCGTLFRITLTGKLTNLYSFCPAEDCTTGYQPYGPLVQGSDGNFYGATIGSDNTATSGADSSEGTVYRLSVGLGPFLATRPSSGRVGQRVP
jgi:uncharacterized repeat protein (TIGR03803 family)